MPYALKDTKAVHELELSPGDIMVPFSGIDYGLKRDHEAITGEEHINLSYDGDTPFYCLPRSAVEAL